MEERECMARRSAARRQRGRKRRVGGGAELDTRTKPNLLILLPTDDEYSTKALFCPTRTPYIEFRIRRNSVNERYGLGNQNLGSWQALVFFSIRSHVRRRHYPRGRRTSLAANFGKTSWRARSHRSIFSPLSLSLALACRAVPCPPFLPSSRKIY